MLGLSVALILTMGAWEQSRESLDRAEEAGSKDVRANRILAHLLHLAEECFDAFALLLCF